MYFFLGFHQTTVVFSPIVHSDGLSDNRKFAEILNYEKSIDSYLGHQSLFIAKINRIAMNITAEERLVCYE